MRSTIKPVKQSVTSSESSFESDTEMIISEGQLHESSFEEDEEQTSDLSIFKCLGPIRRLSRKEESLIKEVRLTLTRLLAEPNSRVHHISSCPLILDAKHSKTFECFSDLKAHYG
jgi:hypothetical protein